MKLARKRLTIAALTALIFVLCLTWEVSQTKKLNGRAGKKAKLKDSHLKNNCGLADESGSSSHKTHRVKRKAHGYPAYVRLNVTNRDKICGGTLLGAHHILTAASCVKKHDQVKIIIPSRGDLNNNNEVAIAYRSSKICRHPNYEGSSLPTNDVAIVKLEEEVQFDESIWPACLPKEHPPWGIAATEIYSIKDHESNSSSFSTKILSMKRNYCNLLNFRRSVMCFKTNKRDRKISTCPGDTGGPVMRIEKGRLSVIAIRSYGPNSCGTHSSAIVYADVYRLVKDIKKLISKCE